jgi:hypothetical protein
VEAAGDAVAGDSFALRLAQPAAGAFDHLPEAADVEALKRLKLTE